MFLNNIIKIEITAAKNVSSSFVMESLTECSVSSSVSWQELNIEVPAKMTVEEEVRDKQVFSVVQLQFRGCEGQIPSYAVCMRLTLHNGKKILLGDGGRPHLMSLQKSNHPDNATDSQLAEYTVKRVCRNKPLLIKG